MGDKHRLLIRQINKYIGTGAVPAGMEAFFEAVSQAYYDFDKDRLMIERSMEISSQELIEINGQLTSTTTAIKNSYDRLQAMQDQLMQAEKMAAVGQLAGGVAHDLNNQLTPIRGYMDMLLRQVSPTDPIYPLLQEANQAAIRCAEVVQRLVSFSRHSTQKKTTLDLVNFLKNFKKLLANFLPSTVRVDISPETDLWAINANETELHTVLVNLAANARDAMPDGGVLTLAAKNAELHGQTIGEDFHSGQYVVISVRDTGVGMFPNTVKRIFEPFFSTKPKDKGTGLGLAMAFNIVQDHGGWIDVSSEIGVGTVFQIYLPKHTVGERLQRQETPSKEVLLRGSETVLFADDEERMRTLGKVFLERLGYQVLLVSDGKEAVETYRNRKNDIDVLILDMTMPHLTGRQTLQKILSINPTAKIILASGYTNEGTAEELIHEGAKDFIHKPFTITLFAKTLRKVLDS